jgi:YHS domain-containing protein
MKKMTMLALVVVMGGGAAFAEDMVGHDHGVHKKKAISATTRTPGAPKAKVTIPTASTGTAAAITASTTTAVSPALKPQATCPVMGGPVDPSQYVDYKGKRIYVCCGGCVKAVRADPEKYLKILAERGEAPESIK